MQNYLKSQVKARERLAEDDFRQEMEAQQAAQALLDQQQKNFYSYAEQAVKDWQGAGKNVKPLILELKGYKKKIV